MTCAGAWLQLVCVCAVNVGVLHAWCRAGLQQVCLTHHLAFQTCMQGIHKCVLLTGTALLQHSWTDIVLTWGVACLARSADHMCH